MYSMREGNEECTQQNFSEKINEETWVCAREDYIESCRRESLKTYIVMNLQLEIPWPSEWFSGFEEGPLGVHQLHS
jgi:hypothetical protein